MVAPAAGAESGPTRTGSGAPEALSRRHPEPVARHTRTGALTGQTERLTALSRTRLRTDAGRRPPEPEPAGGGSVRGPGRRRARAKPATDAQPHRPPRQLPGGLGRKAAARETARRAANAGVRGRFGRGPGAGVRSRGRGISGGRGTSSAAPASLGGEKCAADRPEMPTVRPARSACDSPPQVETVRRCSGTAPPSPPKHGWRVTRNPPLPTTRTFRHQLRRKRCRSRFQTRALQAPSVPRVIPTAGYPTARDGGAIRSRSATTSSSLISCHPGVRWLCRNATPARFPCARRRTLDRYDPSKLALP